MPLNPFHFHGKSTTDPALGSFAVTPNDGSDLTTNVRSITINGAGTVRWTHWDGTVHNTNVLPVGAHPMMASRIHATGTTATQITGWV